MSRTFPLSLVAALLLAILPALDAGAQSRDADFLFSPPGFSLTIRAGMMDYQATGQLFDFTRDRFVTDGAEFRGGSLGAELGVAIGDRLEATLGIDGGQVTVHHEDRDWVEMDGSPIHQSTRVRTGPAAQLGLKGYLLPRGEAIGRFAWIPTRVNAFATGGFGVGAYEFRQFGDFAIVEEDDPDAAVIIENDYRSDGSTFLLYAGAGGELSLRRNLALTLEGRYHWAEDAMEGDFREFEPINLNGLRLTAGLSVRF